MTRKLIRIGTGADTDVTLDIEAVVYSRALIQANSGGGKTGLLRVIAEQVAATIPTVIIDKEGEFYTLREKLDLVLVGEQGELAADVRSAGLLARKLIELGASAVIDLSGLKSAPQQQFVKNFLESLMDLPRKLWHPTLIMIDEAHLFCPEKGMGEAESTLAVIDLMTRGRKRGFGGLLATTRLSKLHKNAADANNIFIGRTVLDVDQVRAGKNLGMKGADVLKLRDLETREFYAYGPDLNFKGVEIFRVADAETTMPKPGAHRSLAPPKASHVVVEIADKLKDIQQEAEAEIKTLNDARDEVAKLKREVKTLRSGQQPREQDTKRIAELTTALGEAKERTRTETKTVEKKIVVAGDLTRLEKASESLSGIAERLRESVDRVEVERAKVAAALTEAREVNAMTLAPAVLRAVRSRPVLERPTVAAESIRRIPVHSNGDERISGVMEKILTALAEFEAIGVNRVPKVLAGFMAGYSNLASKSFANAMGSLRTGGYITYPDSDSLAFTDKGRNAGPQGVPALTQAELEKRIKQLLGGPAAKIVDVLINIYPQAMSKAELAEKCGYTNVASKSFANAIGRLRTMGFVDYPESGSAAATEMLFPG